MTAYSPPTSGLQVIGHRQSLVNRDLYLRFLPWPLLLLATTVVIAIIDGDWLGKPAWIIVLCALYLTNWLLHRNTQPPAAEQAQQHRIWQRGVWLHIYTTSLLWGMFYGWLAWSQPVLSYPFLVATGVTQALAFSGCDTYPMHPRKNMVSLLLMQLPCLLAMLAQGQPVKVVIFFAVLLGLQWARTRASAQHYERQLSGQIALQESRSEIERLTSYDVLTGLINRRGLENTLYNQWHLAARQQSALSLIALDLDYIKHINERHGHSAGDACLQHTAQLLRAHFKRSTDLVARMGGDSFAVLLPQTDGSEAMRLAQALREQLSSHPLDWYGQALRVTASIGVDCARWDIDLSPGDTLKRITAASHDAKAQGRNRVLQA